MLVWVVCANSCLLGALFPSWECSSAREQDTGPLTLTCVPQHCDLRGPQPGCLVSLVQLTRSQADLG